MRLLRTPASSLQRQEGAEEAPDRALAKQHPKTEELELYALNRLSGTSLNRIKKHLRTCVSCRQRFVELSNFATAVKNAFLSDPNLRH